MRLLEWELCCFNNQREQKIHMRYSRGTRTESQSAGVPPLWGKWFCVAVWTHTLGPSAKERVRSKDGKKRSNMSTMETEGQDFLCWVSMKKVLCTVWQTEQSASESLSWIRLETDCKESQGRPIYLCLQYQGPILLVQQAHGFYWVYFSIFLD